MEKPQNIYDESSFFNEYQTMRNKKINANELIEIPTIKSMLPNLKGKTVLDLGCGAGAMSQYFAKCGAKSVLGLDISSNMIGIAKSENTHKNVSFVELPMEDISSINKKFDVVFSSLAFHYIEDFDKLMKDIHKLLKSKGTLVFSQEHPLNTATILTSNEMENYVFIDGKRYYLLSDYNNVSKREVHWNGQNVTKHHRNFSSILNSFVRAGFELEEIQEPMPSKEALSLVEKYKYQKDKPYFVFFRLRKK
jgi:ubiquinone/menaquinone biosynthesis C-methylase UbiE